MSGTDRCRIPGEADGKLNKKYGHPGWGAQFSCSAAAAVVVAVVPGSGAAGIAAATAAIAQQQNQDDDPPPVIAAEAVAYTVIVTHKDSLRNFY